MICFHKSAYFIISAIFTDTCLSEIKCTIYPKELTCNRSFLFNNNYHWIWNDLPRWRVPPMESINGHWLCLWRRRAFKLNVICGLIWRGMNPPKTTLCISEYLSGFFNSNMWRELIRCSVAMRSHDHTLSLMMMTMLIGWGGKSEPSPKWYTVCLLPFLPLILSS